MEKGLDTDACKKQTKDTMAEVLNFHLGDGFEKIKSKALASKSRDVFLVIPKDSSVFKDPFNLIVLEREMRLSLKKVVLVTTDPFGLGYGASAGIEVRSVLPKFKKGAVTESKSSDVPETTTDKVLSEFFDTPVQALQTLTTKPPRLSSAVGMPKKQNHGTIWAGGDDDRFEFKKKTSFGRKLIAGVMSLVLLLSVSVFGFLYPKTYVVITEKPQPIMREMEVVVSSSVDAVDEVNAIIPGRILKETIATSVQVSVTGKKEFGTKSRGKVRVYNFARSPLNLRSSNTKLVIDGKNYVFVDPLVSVKVSRDNRGVLESQNAEVVIEAVSPGEAFNLEEGKKLEIRNTVFGNQPDVLYAEVSTEVVGGNVRYVSQVASSDIELAKNEVASSSVATLMARLQANGESMVPGGAKVVMQSFYTEEAVGTESATVLGSGKAVISATVWKTDQLAALVEKSVGGAVDGVKFANIVNKTMEIEKKQYNALNGNLILSVSFKGVGLPVHDDASVVNSVAGQSKLAALEVLKARPDVLDANVTLFPDWFGKIPKMKRKVRVEWKNAENGN